MVCHDTLARVTLAAVPLDVTGRRGRDKLLVSPLDSWGFLCKPAGLPVTGSINALDSLLLGASTGRFINAYYALPSWWRAFIAALRSGVLTVWRLALFGERVRHGGAQRLPASWRAVGHRQKPPACLPRWAFQRRATPHKRVL